MDLPHDLMVGDLVLINEDIDHDDPVALEYENKHAYIKAFIPPYAEVEFLNGDIHRVMIKNIRKHIE